MPFSGSGSGSDVGDYKNLKKSRVTDYCMKCFGLAKRATQNQHGRCSLWTNLLSRYCLTHAQSLTLQMKVFHVQQCICLTAHNKDIASFVVVLERIEKKRQPMPCMDAIYFIRPSKENVRLFLSDMSGRAPLYRNSPISKELVSRIKEEGSVLSRISALIEMNLEYFPIDSQGFVTNNERALEQLYGDEEDSCKGVTCLNEMAARIATVFASLREFPFVRYRAAKSLDATTMTTFRDLIPTKLAAGIWDCLMKYKKTIPNFPMAETCELLVLDRSVDQIAPIIHEWTYDAMCHDLLNMEGNKYVHEVPSKTGGLPEKKVVVLEEHDPVWLELRHEHIKVVMERLNEKITNFYSKNKAARFQNSRDVLSRELSTRELKEITEALPEYIEQKEKLSLHAEIARKINKVIKDLRLPELAQLEQDLVFGYKGIKDVVKYLTTEEGTTCENKLRLLMILAAIYPEKFEGQEGLQIMMKIAKLQPHDMSAVSNMKLIGESRKGSSGIFPLKFGISKKNRAARKELPSEETLLSSRFYPVIEELVEKLSKGELSKEEYPCLNDPSPTLNQAPNAHSMRSRRAPTWATQRCNSIDGISRYASSDFKKMGKRIFVVIVGGATRSELRVCHQLTSKLKREVVLGSSSLDDPATFVTKLKMITAEDQLLTLDDLYI